MLISELRKTSQAMDLKMRSWFSGLVVSIKDKTSTKEEIHLDNGPKFSSTTEQVGEKNYIKMI